MKSPKMFDADFRRNHEFFDDLFEKSVDAFVKKDHRESFGFRSDIKPDNVLLAFGRYLANRYRSSPTTPFDATQARIMELHDFTPTQIAEFKPIHFINALPQDWDDFINQLPEQVQVLTVNIIRSADQ